MNNPYEPPGGGYTPAQTTTFNRRPFVLAAIGAWLAALYWLGMTLLLGAAVASGGLGPAQLILPFVLIGLYAHRGWRLYNADPRMIRSILMLHGLGIFASIMQITAAKNEVVTIMNGVKIAIHVFGMITAFLAKRALDDARV